MTWTGTRGAPLLGQHTREILAGLDYPRAEVAELESAGVVTRSAVPRDARQSVDLPEIEMDELENAGAAHGQETAT